MFASLLIAQATVTTPIDPGVQYSQYTLNRTAIYVVTAQMNRVNIVMTPPNPTGSDTNLETTEVFAKRHKTLAALNTNFFSWIRPEQLRGIQDYLRWMRGRSDIRFSYPDFQQTCVTGSGTIPAQLLGAYFVNGRQVRPRGESFRAIVNFPAQGGMEFYQNELPPNPHNLIAGQAHLIRQGQFQKVGADRLPKTIVGQRPHEYVFVVTDGRGNNGSPGLTFAELQPFLRGLGVTDATALDGGESSTLVVRGDVKNYPQDPHCAVARLLPASLGRFPFPAALPNLTSTLSQSRSLRPTGANLGLVARL